MHVFGGREAWLEHQKTQKLADDADAKPKPKKRKKADPSLEKKENPAKKKKGAAMAKAKETPSADAPGKGKKIHHRDNIWMRSADAPKEMPDLTWDELHLTPEELAGTPGAQCSVPPLEVQCVRCGRQHSVVESTQKSKRTWMCHKCAQVGSRLLVLIV
jgi:hypothetical protein